jgi:hypothetical protein
VVIYQPYTRASHDVAPPAVISRVGDVWSPDVAASVPSCRNTDSGMANSLEPQSMQIRRSGNAKTGGLFRSLSPGKWMTISTGKRCWFSELHELHAISFTPHQDVFDHEPEFREQTSLPYGFGSCAKQGCRIMARDLDGMPARAILRADSFPEMNDVSSDSSRAPNRDLRRDL